MDNPVVLCWALLAAAAFLGQQQRSRSRHGDPALLRSLILQLENAMFECSTVDLVIGAVTVDSNQQRNLERTRSSWVPVFISTRGISSSEFLTVLDLSSCRITGKSEVELFSDGLKGSDVHLFLKKLTLSGNPGFGKAWGCRKLSAALSTMTSLIVLRLGRVEMEVAGLTYIISALTQSKSMQDLYVWENGKLGDAGATLLADFLSDVEASKKLRMLNVRQTGMGIRGAAALSKALLLHKLDDLVIGEKSTRKKRGLLYMAHAGSLQRPLEVVLLPMVLSPTGDTLFPQCYAIRRLFIRDAQEEGLGHTVIQILATNSQLKSLSLDGSVFPVQDWQGIFMSLVGNTTLKTLSARRCPGVEGALPELEELVQCREIPLKIDLGETELEKQGKDVIIRMALMKMPHSRKYFLQNAGSILQVRCLDSDQEVSSGSSLIDISLNSVSAGLRQLLGHLSNHSSNSTLEPLPPLFLQFATGELSRRKWWELRLEVLGLINTHPTLTVVDLGLCNIRTESEVKQLCGGLQQNRVLKELRLDSNPGFGSEFGTRQLCSLLHRCPSLEVLDLGIVGMDARGLKLIIGVLTSADADRPALRELLLDQNKCLGDVDALVLLGGFLRNRQASSSLKRLSICETGISVEGAGILSEALRAHSNLDELIIGETEKAEPAKPGPTSVLLMPRVWCSSGSEVSFYSITSIGIVNARETGLGEIVAQMLAAKNTALRTVCLNGSYFQGADWHKIFQSLEHNTVLETLSLEDCDGLNETDASVLVKDLIKVMEVRATPLELRFDCTALTRDETIVLIANALKMQPGSRRRFLLDSGYSPPVAVAAACNWEPEGSSSAARVSTTPMESKDLDSPVETCVPQGLRNLMQDLMDISSSGTATRHPALAPQSHSRSLLAVNTYEYGDYFNSNHTTSRVQWLNIRMEVVCLIGNCHTLVEIELTGCCIESEKEVRILCQGLCDNPFLEKLFLDQNKGFGSEDGCQQVSLVIGKSTALQVLTMHDVGMQAEGLKCILEALGANHKSRLHSLSIHFNRGLEDLGVTYVADFLLQGSHSSSRLQKLRMSHVNMGTVGAKCLAKALLTNTSLQKLEVGEDDHRLQPITCFLKNVILPLDGESGIQTNHAFMLETLCITASTEEGLGESLANVLKNNVSLQKLVLSEVQLSTSGWSSVFESLTVSKCKLETLSLKRSSGLDGAYIDLLKLLEVNTRINVIDLSGTTLETSGRDAQIREALRKNYRRRGYLTLFKDKLNTVDRKAGRLFLCGSPSAGKTTLWRRIAHCLELLPPDKKFWQSEDTSAMVQMLQESQKFKEMSDEFGHQTQGIDIHNMKYAGDLQISVWDLAGQAQYHVLHQCLFPDTSYPCVFLFVFNVVGDRKDDATDATAEPANSTEKLEQDLTYWLRFIASNSSTVGCKPNLSVVFTHLDKLVEEDLPHMVEPEMLKLKRELEGYEVLKRLRREFEGSVNVSAHVHLVGSGKELFAHSIPNLLQHIFDDFGKLVSQVQTKVPRQCDEVIRRLTQYSQQDNAKPLLSLQEFNNLCFQILNEEFGNGYGDVEEPSALTSYLHSIGEIFLFKALDYIAVSPHWLAHSLLGQLMNPDIYRQKFSGFSKDGNVPVERLKNFLQECAQRGSKTRSSLSNPIPSHVLVEIMCHLNLCYLVDDGRFFVPTLLYDPEELASKGKPHLEWPAQNDAKRSGSSGDHMGRRLQCNDFNIKFLTPGSFPIFQVGFRKFPPCSEEKSLYKCGRNLVSWLVDGFEVLVECGGYNDTYVDILMRSCDKTHLQNLMFMESVLKDAKDFFATTCRGLTFSESILRPECVKKLTPFAQRKSQSVRVEKLCERMSFKYQLAEKETGASGALKSVIDYEHTWPGVDAGPGPASDAIVALLGARESLKMFEKWKAVRQDRHFKAFCEEKVRDFGMETDEGLKEALLVWCGVYGEGGDSYPMPNSKLGSDGRRGLALIISIEKYDEVKYVRDGASVDRGQLRALARMCEFKVRELVDQTADELRIAIQAEAENGVMEDDCCFWCCVSAHGDTDSTNKNFIYAKDNEKLYLADILLPFTTNPVLLDKPKVFFINSCRGHLRYSNYRTCEVPPPRVLGYLSDIAHCLVVFSTSEKAVSIRHPVTGTMFIEALAKGITERRNRDLLTIIRDVRSKLVDHKTSLYDEEGKPLGKFGQCPVVYETLTKRLYWW